MKKKPTALWSDRELCSILDAHLPKVKLYGTDFSERLTNAMSRELFLPSPVYRATVHIGKLSPVNDLLLHNPKKDFFSPTERFCMDMEEGEVKLIADPCLPKKACFMVLEKTSLPPSESGVYFSIPESIGVQCVQLCRYVDTSKFKSEEGVVQWD